MTTILGPWSSLDEIRKEGGGKAFHLAEVGTLSVVVPAWCCVPASAFDEFRAGFPMAELTEGAQTADEVAARIEARFLRMPVSDELRREIRSALARLGLTDTFVAVRSSGIGEDSAEHSFAGQFSSFLFQREERQIIDALRCCWASAYSARNFAYREATGLEAGQIRMGVVIQKMVNADSAGVVFTRNPLRATDRTSMIVESVFGLGEGLVSGELDADRFEVNRDTLVIHPVVAAKVALVAPDPKGGTRTVSLTDAEGSRPSLSDDQVREVATLGLRLEEAFGAPQDVEWAFEAGQLHCLQTRPITTLPPDSLFSDAARANVVIWDNSNIIESFAGVTTPLTFTHVNRCYYEVYLQFCRVMGVDDDVIRDHDSMFRNMLGMVRGRIYYNLVNWYRLLGLFPGVSHTKGFMETMMGVQQSMTPELAALFDGVRNAPKPSLARQATIAAQTTYRLTRTQGYIDDFMERIDRVYVPLETADLRALSLDEQIDLYHRLETDVLMHWTAPIVNDTRCMVAFGILGGLTKKWLPDREGEPGFETLRNDLLCGEGDLKSTEPTKLLMRIAATVDADAGVRARFASDAPDALWNAMQQGWAPHIHAIFTDFLRRYGFRCVNELKLEEPDLHDDPRFVVSSVQSYVRMGSYSIDAMESREKEIRAAAEERVLGRLSGVKRRAYLRAVRWTRRAVSDRELLRFERTRTFGVTRRLFRAMGANLVKAGAIDNERDVFYLTLTELLSLGGRDQPGDLRERVTARRKEFDGYRNTTAPPDRFVTRGPIDVVEKYPMLLLEGDLLVEDAADDDPSILRGTACSPGVVEGVIRVAHRFEDAEGMNGEILVTERTDPGWVPLFPACGGLIIERGSLLSHSAVVARELGLPTIVGVRGKPMQRLKTGMRVRMDGGKGEIRIL